MKGDNFNKEVDKIITSQVNEDGLRLEDFNYIPDEDKFTDWLEFCKLFPRGDYIQFRKFCQEKNKKEV